MDIFNILMLYVNIKFKKTNYAEKYVKIFENFYLIIRDIAILSEICMEFGNQIFIIMCVNLFIMLLFLK